MSDLALYLGVAAAGAIGAPARYLVDRFAQGRTTDSFPFGTLLVNLSGSLLLGFITGLVLYHAFPQTPQVLLGTGFCGAYTTFSTFTFEAVRLGEEGATGEPFAYVSVSVAGGTLAAALGLLLAAL